MLYLVEPFFNLADGDDRIGKRRRQFATWFFQALAILQSAGSRKTNRRALCIPRLILRGMELKPVLVYQGMRADGLEILGIGDEQIGHDVGHEWREMVMKRTEALPKRQG